MMSGAKFLLQTARRPTLPFCCTFENLICRSARKQVYKTGKTGCQRSQSTTCLVVCKRCRSTSWAATTLQNLSKHVCSRSTNRSGRALDAISCILIPALEDDKPKCLLLQKFTYLHTEFLHPLYKE